jgi:hypothetical protein
MKLLFVLLCLVLSTGCASKKEKRASSGPLSEIEQYQVIPVFSPSEASDKEVLINHLVEMLGKLGTVHISTGCISDIPASNAVLVITIDEFGQSKTGSIKIFAEGEVIVNKHKASCDVWTTLYHDPTLPYPINEENGIVFKQDLTAKSPDMKAVASQLVSQFAERYLRDNPESKPTFHVYSKMF